jgi:hypothetical protein
MADFKLSVESAEHMLGLLHTLPSGRRRSSTPLDLNSVPLVLNDKLSLNCPDFSYCTVPEINAGSEVLVWRFYFCKTWRSV